MNRFSTVARNTYFIPITITRKNGSVWTQTFATAKQMKQQRLDARIVNKRTEVNRSQVEQEPVNDVNVLLRKFYRKCHPDLIRSRSTEFAEINDSSMKVINGILTTVKEKNSYPPRLIKDVPFYLNRSDDRSQFDCVALRIRTGGGECKKQLTLSFEQFFKDAGLSQDGKFVWSKEYFPVDVVHSASRVVCTMEEDDDGHD